MAVMAYLLREYANEEVDIAKVMLMCLIHDIVEIDAGDTYAYDAEASPSAFVSLYFSVSLYLFYHRIRPVSFFPSLFRCALYLQHSR